MGCELMFLFLIGLFILLWVVALSMTHILFRYGPFYKPWRYLICICILVPYSFSLQMQSWLGPWVGFLQFAAAILLLRCVMGHRWIQAVVMFGTSFTFMNFMEILTTLVINYTHIDHAVQRLRGRNYLEGFISIAAVGMLTLLLHKFRIGFTFLRTTRERKYPTAFIICAALICTGQALGPFLAFTSQWIIVLEAFFLLVLLFFLQSSYRKELED
jgi:hypothetical protein